jgi:hypothetical protein
VVATASLTSVCQIPANTTLRGSTRGMTNLWVDSDAPGTSASPGAYRQGFVNAGANTAIEHLTIKRIAPYAQFVMFPVNAFDGVTLRNVVVDGNGAASTGTGYASGGQVYCHGLQVGNTGTTSTIRLIDCRFMGMTYALFPNERGAGRGDRCVGGTL